MCGVGFENALAAPNLAGITGVTGRKTVKPDTEKGRGTTAESRKLVSVNVGGSVVLDDDTELRVAPDDLTRISAWRRFVKVRIEPPRNPGNRPFQEMINEVTGEVVNVIVRELPHDPFSQLVKLSKKD